MVQIKEMLFQKKVKQKLSRIFLYFKKKKGTNKQKKTFYRNE